ncbi:hypothetical protein [Paramicrobacterium chengjingii]|uniref:arsenate reductase/protein-tyrosine-phosphatase family protein n=1 Tax=Paramicrobacterium chengjingii TaxID=2769067 RepID=UPI00246802B1|nr:hypothetical protein [Microbacterium chengjingii]
MNPRNGDVSDTFVITTVCEGNICRSPLAERLLRESLAPPDFKVESAGLRALVGHTMDSQAAAVAERLGCTTAPHSGRQIDGLIVAGSSVLLTMTKSQRDMLVQMHPRALRKTFTLAEFAALCSEEAAPVTAGNLTTIVGTFAQRRSEVRLTNEDDIEDPYLKSLEVHARVGEKISLLCAEIINNFRES